ncbi:hypothetical protein SAMN05444483_10513 [Salegentibacter echinorum]|uniref:Uncharacterized protein n=1 Tax=Salegentibacter echinorum TaxID=1073325 RepID=A0A1M5H6Q9_SALEC|nr:hypothetical protein [Salegentibacter echinorum]SHG11687.1 hypothetical protein SAMN05444483_10513 [Salegentibacter echinorum]
MEMEIKKLELLRWLSDVEDREVLAQVEAINEDVEKESGFDFDKEWENGYTGKEFKAEMRKRINSYPWKK